MQLEMSTDGSTVVIHVNGDLNTLEAPRFEAEVLELLSRSRGTVACDLSKLRYMNSSGIRAFVRIKRNLDQSGRHLVLFGATDSVQGVFELTRLDMLFDIREEL